MPLILVIVFCLKAIQAKYWVGICDKKEITYPVTTGSKPKEYCTTALVKQETVDFHFNYGTEPIDDKLTRYYNSYGTTKYYFGNDSQLISDDSYINQKTVKLITYWGDVFDPCGRVEIKNSSPKMLVYFRGSDIGVNIVRYQYVTIQDTITWDIKK